MIDSKNTMHEEDEGGPLVKKLYSEYARNIPNSNFVFEVTKWCTCCEYSFLEIIKKDAPIEELYRNVEWTLGYKGKDCAHKLRLCFLKNLCDAGSLEENKVVIPRTPDDVTGATRSPATLRTFIQDQVPWKLAPIYPLPAAVIYRVWLEEIS